jgi:sensor c-di-GMP phosphodiesterase-like protein
MTINVMGTELPWVAYVLLILIGLTSGLFVVPMNALLQHRGHVLLSAGHSIAVQNFNEQLNILVMVAVYTLLLWADMSIDVIIWIFGGLVASIMVVMMQWNLSNLNKNPKLLDEIGQEGHGKAL